MKCLTGFSSSLFLCATLLVALFWGTCKSEAGNDCDSFPLELGSCFFAVGGGFTPLGAHIPQPQTNTPECIALYKEYFKQGGQYWKDTETAIEAGKSILEEEGNYTQMIIFDIDDTTVSNIPLFESVGFTTPTEEQWFTWITSTAMPAIPATLQFYRDLIAKGYSVSFVSGRTESTRNLTVANLLHEGFGKQCMDVPISQGAVCYVDLVMRADDDPREYTVLKSEARGKLKKAGFNLVASVGDQWFDLLGTDSPPSIIKLPNPLYYFP